MSLLLLLKPATGSVTYLLGPFRFETARAAPLPSPYTEAGAAGSLVLDDASNTLAVSGGKLAASGTSPASWYGPTGVARLAGRALLWDARWVAMVAYTIGGWTRAAAIPSGAYTNVAGGLATNNTGSALGLADNGTNWTNLDFGALATATDHAFAVVLRGAGQWYLARGGAFGAGWALVWVSPYDATPTVYLAGQNNQGSVVGFDNLRVADLGGAWATDYGIATDRKAGARAQGDTFAHTADCLIECVVTTLPASTLEVRFRAQDASNYWAINSNAGGACILYEVVANTYTNRGGGASGLANGYRMVIVASGTTIAVFTNNTLLFSYGLAATFQTATSGVLSLLGSGAVADIVTWPRNPAVPSGV